MKYLMLFTVVFLLFSCSDNSVTSNESKLHISLEPLQSSVNLGDEIQLDILIIECSIPIFAICLQIEFDNEILSYADSTALIIGDYFGENLVSFAQESDGIIHITFSLVQGINQISGSGTLCTITLEALNIGTSPINILPDEITIYNQEGNLIEIDNIEINNKIIEVM
jgi:Cohesin domain